MPNFPSREELLGSLPGPIPVQDQMSGTGPEGRTIYCYKELLEYPLVISHQSGTVLTKKIKELLLLFLVDDQFSVSGACLSVIELGVTELKADLKE